MFAPHLQNALLFSLHTICSIYISIVIIRFLLQLVRADFYNPVTQFIVKATNPVLVPLRKIIPGWLGIDWSCVLVALLLQSIEIGLTLYIKGFTVAPTVPSISGLLIWSSGELIDATLVICMIATFVQIVASWIAGSQYNPFVHVCTDITAPVFNRIRNIMPNTGMLDLSPMVVIFLIILLRLLLADFIIALGKSII